MGKNFWDSGWSGYNGLPEFGGKSGITVVNTSSKPVVKCLHTHPAMPITVAGKTFHVYGGSGRDPIHSDCDIYVALDGSTPEHKSFYPWNNPGRIFVSFYITDMTAPKDVDEFKRMIVWMGDQIIAGKKVHVGCIGGHGRTGTVLTALVRVMMNEEDAISYVRKHYCGKAVEAYTQVQFLHKEFGIKKVEAAKTDLWFADSKPKGKVVPVTMGDFNSKYTKSDLIPLNPLEDFGSIWYPASDT